MSGERELLHRTADVADSIDTLDEGPVFPTVNAGLRELIEDWPWSYNSIGLNAT